MEKRVCNAAASFSKKFKDFRPFPPASDRDAWKTLSEPVKAQLLTEAEALIGYDYPVMRATDYMKFKRTGNRSDYEQLFFDRRHALNSLILGECVEHQGRFLDDIVNGIFCICEESAWQFPAHNSYIRDTPQFILPDPVRPVVDLFSAKTGALLATAYYLLKDSLDTISPFICTRIFEEVQRRILKPYLTQHFWWMGDGVEHTCNWTVWCTQNVLLSSFLLPFAEDTRKAVFDQAVQSCDFFLNDYGEDGCCDEGAQYYHQAGLCLYQSLDLLNQIADGIFQPLFSWSKIRNIANYVVNVHIDGIYYLNFADCSAVAGQAGVREYLFGKATGQPDLMRFAATDFKATHGALYMEDISRYNLFCRLQTIFYYDEMMLYPTDEPVLAKDIFYSSAGLLVARSNTFCLAAKAGHNNDSHNHNDTGSFILYQNARPVFVDIGVGSYTAKTFSSERYDIWTMQSGYHNLPTIAGTDQLAGEEFAAKDVSTQLSDHMVSITMDIADAYPSALPYRREIVLDKDAEVVTITDETDNTDVILNFITYEKPKVTDSQMQLGDLACVKYSGASLLSIDTLPITDPRLQQAWDHDLYRIRLTLHDSLFRMEIHAGQLPV